MRSPARATAVRLAATVFLIYAVHFASNVVRETYLAITLGERLSVRVDEYLGLHPDLFEIPGRGAYINNNPGASMLAAVPYALARPGIALLFRLRPDLARPKPPGVYADPRPNRTRFLNESRARGLDVKLALAALITDLGLMVPLGALGAVVMFMTLRRRVADERVALLLALLYAFGTPIFFRSAFLNQNAIVAHAVLFAFVLVAGWGRDIGRASGHALPRPLVAAGALLGVATLCDYSGVPIALAFAAWCAAIAWRAAGPGAAMRASMALAVGAAGPIALLLGYQWIAFGNPFFPAQRYMPPTPYSQLGWHGVTLPDPELLWRNLFDPRYGLFVFSPMLIAAAAAPFLRARESVVNDAELGLIFGASAALYLFSSANEYGLLQWNTGVRYMVPAAPLLFIALVPVLLRAGGLLRYVLIVPTLAISWAVAMAREDVPTSLVQVFVGGFQLPFLTVLRKTASSYAPFVAEVGVSPLPIFVLVGVTLWLMWRGHVPVARAGQWRYTVRTPAAGIATSTEPPAPIATGGRAPVPPDPVA